ncbi:MAG TPA: hypothetical protein VJP81_10870 [Candidatus Dormibacteraeota bacterium]|nr:hypothetical protein [Candidatus Dormibacteraeota bacterium]
MDDLRSEIRSAFEREQAAHPPAAGLRRDIVQAVLAPPRRQTSMQWLAVAVAALLGMAVVVGLMSARLAQKASVPAATPQATPSSLDRDYGPPPAGVPLFYVESPSHRGWYIGFDWTGKPRGTIKVAIAQSSSLYQAPDGSGFAMEPSGNLGFYQFLDRLGQQVGIDPTPYQSQMWADDSRHLCVLEGNSGQWKIGLRAPGAAPASLHQVALDSSNLRSDLINRGFSSCSAQNDRAIITYSFVGAPAEVWVVRISDGSILFHKVDQANTFSAIVASGDGGLIADNSGQSLGYDAGPTPPATLIERAADGSTVRALDPSIRVLAFSGDDRLALVTTAPNAAGRVTHLALVRVADGSVLWRYDGGLQYTESLIEPNGSAIVVMQQSQSDEQVHPSVGVVILHPDGTSIPLEGEFIRP